jgi:flagellar biosynthesis repressor protein FlbT
VALKVELKPNERIIIGTAVVRNCDQRTSLIIEGNAPILREKDILSPKSADTPAKLIYMTIQLMYIDGKISENIGLYNKFITDFQKAVPSSTNILMKIHNHILDGEFYKALKEAKQLLAYERKLFEHAASNSSLQQDPDPRLESARA